MSVEIAYLDDRSLFVRVLADPRSSISTRRSFD